MELLEKHFDTALESPDGIKKLRELILTLAMQGKLVPQDPKDQPASELLKEIQTEKEKLIKEGKIKKQKELSPIKSEEVPYKVPEGWEWARLGDIADLIGGFAYDSKKFKSVGDKQVLRLGNIRPDMIRLDENPVFIDEIKAKETSAFQLQLGDIIITMTGTRDKRDYLYTVRVLENPMNGKTLFLNQRVGAIRLFIDSKFLNKALKNESLKDIIYQTSTGSANQANIGMVALKNWTIPIPPLTEQKRIVDKIDELMALCAKLEKQQQERDVKRLKAHESAINLLLTASDKKSFNSSWQFIASHFDSLYSVIENITELKKTILVLAMQGKLVPQDPKDQPASELLKEIQTEKEKLIKEGKIKKQKELSPIKSEEVPYKVPEGWEWTKLGELSSVYTGKKDVNEGHENGQYPFFSCAQIPLKSNDFSYDTEALLLPGNGANVGQVIYYKGKFEAYQRTYILSDFYQDTIVFVQKTLEARFLKSLEGKQYGSAINYIKLGSLTDYLVPLPPIAEQKRIVAKIDELMSLCDNLELNIPKATKKQTELFDSVLSKV